VEHAIAPVAVDARPLALLRIGLGAVVLIDLGDRLRDFHAFYTSAALVPAPAPAGAASVLQRWSLLAISNDSRVALAIFVLAFVAALLLMLGLFTRAAAAATLIALVSLHHRNSYIEGGGDAVLRALAFWSIFIDVGARLSLDVRLNRRAALDTIPGLPVRLLQLQIAMIYLFAFLGKTGPTWRDGSAVLQALSTADWARGAGPWLASHPSLCRGLTWTTLAFEAAFAPLVFWPARLPWPAHLPRPRAIALGAGWLLHGGIFLTMRVGNFCEAMALSYLALVPAAWLDRFVPRPASPARSAPQLRRPHAIALILVFALVFAGQIAAALAIPLRPVTTALEAGGMRQDWRVFAPDAPRLDVTFTAPGQLTNGQPIDLIESTLAPLAPQHGFRYSRWHRLRNLLATGPADLTAALGRYTCRRTPALAHFTLTARIRSPDAPPINQLRLTQDCAPP
jgi:uncharacterized membrane protein YphA (DoxX/SURF4 family)